MTTTHPSFSRPTQNPVLPWELTDIIIDHLRHDIRTLGVCSAICSEWLVRSRYHIFSTVQLWPWRMRRFVELADDEGCTFGNVITRIEMDDSRVRSAWKFGDGRTKGVPGGKPGRGQQELEGEEKNIMFLDAMAYSGLKCLAHVSAIQVCNVDWTTLSPAEQASLRTQLSKFSRLRRLEFYDVVFHDVREVGRIVRVFPSLHHLTANVGFRKYLEYNLPLCVGSYVSGDALKSIESNTDEGIPVLLSCIALNRNKPHPIQAMNLRNLERKHLQYIRDALRISGQSLQQLSLDFKHEKVSLASEGREISLPLNRADLPPMADDLDFSNLDDLRTLSIGGLQLTSFTVHALIQHTLPKILSRIEAPFLAVLEVRFHLETLFFLETMRCIDWSELQGVLLELHFFGMSTVRIVIEVASSSDFQIVGLVHAVEREIKDGMGELLSRGVLDVRVDSESAAMALKEGLVDDVGDKD